MEIDLKPGLKAKITAVVQPKDTAKAVASGLAEVFSTPSLAALMENAAYTAVQPALSEGYSTVGSELSLRHLAATPVGFTVWAEAVLTTVEGRKLTFFIEAFDESEKIGEAAHTRYVIDSERFINKANAKKKSSE